MKTNKVLRLPDRNTLLHFLLVTYLTILASINEISEVKEKATHYMNETPDDKDFPLLYAYLALVMFWNDEGDNFDVKSALQRITALNLEDDFIAYIEDYCYYPDNTRGDNAYYTGLTTTALRIMREIKNK